MEKLVVFSAEDHQSCIYVMRQDSVWLIDSGATHHAIPRRDVFMTYHSGNFSTMDMVNKDITDSKY